MYFVDEHILTLWMIAVCSVAVYCDYEIKLPPGGIFEGCKLCVQNGCQTSRDNCLSEVK